MQHAAFLAKASALFSVAALVVASSASLLAAASWAVFFAAAAKASLAFVSVAASISCSYHCNGIESE